ncbi:MAG: HAMP domain-containing protein [Burkholderiaceae bacterium]|jgi:two-component system osmolarity sensor histidine kinase EnvZ|nr:HAMP domain-containing protein [Burkholderiaceae bacterium]
MNMPAADPFADDAARLADAAAVPDSMRAPLELPASRHRRRRWQRRLSMSLFWRTFVLLVSLLVCVSLAWLQLFRMLAYEPRVTEYAQQIASLVNLTRTGLIHSDAIARVSLIKTLAENEKVRIIPREPDNRYIPYANTLFERRLSSELEKRLGPGTVVARQVDDEPGLWVGFSIEQDYFWLRMENSRISAFLGGGAWLLWLVTLGVASLVGAALLARLINQPLKQLSLAAARVREGNFEQSRLDENVLSTEIREVNNGFNRMAEQLSKIEQERAEMLAGISHDLRTPLARLRLETELSVPDAEARNLMAADITQVDGIINKFLDYARPGQAVLQAMELAPLVRASALPFADQGDMDLQITIPGNLYVMADKVELSRVLSNLLENARRYGKTPGADTARVRIVATATSDWVTLRLRDEGTGVPEANLPLLARPFYRGDAARTAATGTGLGLSIVTRMVRHMRGTLQISNAPAGGLLIAITLQRAAPPTAEAASRKKRW